MPDYKAVYVSTPKAACTTLKWLVADLQGERPEQFHASLSQEVTRSMCIHRRSMWRRTPTLHELSDEALEAISPENGWFVYAVVRHPAARLWSGWQSKFLLREPRWQQLFGEEPWYPRVPKSTDDVVEDFRRFALSVGENPKQPVMRDRHFRPQHRLIKAGSMPYTRIYDTPEIPQLLDDLDAHLRRQGWTGELSLAPSNETPLSPLARAFTPDVTEAISSVYRADFERLGYDTVLPPKLRSEDEYPASQLAEVSRLIELGERIGDLSRRAQAIDERLREAKVQRRAEAPLDRAVRGVRRRIRALNLFA
jgi:hypothetical protein